MKIATLGKVAKIDRTVASQVECKTLPYVGLEHIEKNTGHFISSFRAKSDSDLLVFSQDSIDG